MTEIEAILSGIALPEVVRVRQTFPNLALPDVSGTLARLLAETQPDIRPGARIAITCGSRGIDHYAALVKGVVDFVRSKGAHPILIPAMGSHGGATAEGQVQVLARYGVTEETTGAPILSSMEVVDLGVTRRGLPVYIDKNAFACDGIILLNRVKPHTAFRGPVESGLLKMVAIGLAKQKGAEMTHLFGFDIMAENILEVSRVAMRRLNIVCGVASIEDYHGQVAELHVLKSDEIPEREPALLRRAFELMPRFYLDEADVAVIQQQGKEMAGTGMDCNVVGRYTTSTASGGPKFRVLAVLDLLDSSEGNANGMGMANLAPRRFYDKIDFEQGYVNSLTSTALESNRMPMILENDRLVLQAAVKCCGQPDTTRASMVFALDTKHIEDLYLSPAALDSIRPEWRQYVEVCGDFFPIPFDEEGNLLLFAHAN
jgi:hypothetical protein